MSSISLVREGEHIGIRELRQNLPKVLHGRRTYFVTDHGKPVRVMLPYEVFLELLEILDELKDKALMQEIAQGRVEYQRGGWIPIARLKRSLK